MIIRNLALALAAAGSTPLLPMPAWADIPAPSVTKHAGVAIITQQDSGAQLAGAAFSVRAGLDRQTNAQNGVAALTAQTIVQSLQSERSRLGGSVTYAVEGGDVRFYIEAATSDEPALLGVFESALRHPDFSAANIDAARAVLRSQIGSDQQAPFAVGLQMLDEQFYGSAGAGFPPSGTATSIAQLAPADAQSFYQRNYVRGGALISAVGSIDSGSLETLAEALRAGSTSAVSVKTIHVASTTRQLVTHRDINAPWLLAQVPAPAAASRDFAAMLVLNAFLDRTLADAAAVPNAISHPFAANSIGTLYNFDQQPANDVIYIDGNLGDPTRAFATAFSVANLLGAAKLQGSIQEYKTVAQGEYSSDLSTLSDRAIAAGIFYQQTGSPEYLNGTLRAIANVSAKDLQHVILTYLHNPTLALVLPRNG